MSPSQRATVTSIWQLAGWFFHVVGRSLMLLTSASMSPVRGVDAERTYAIMRGWLGLPAAGSS